MERYGYVFPYNNVKKGSHIIIWGAGEVGRQFWYQVKQTDYCDVIAVIDNEVRDENMFCNVKPIKYLKDHMADHVLLAIADYEKRREVKEYIAEFYPQISYVEADYYGDICQLNLSVDELYAIEGWKRLFDQFWKFSLGNFSYIQDLIDGIGQCRNKEKIIMTVIQGITKWNQHEQIVALRMLMHAGCFDDRLMKLYHRALSNIKENELCALLLEEIAAFEVSHVEICYPEYFNDRRRIVKNNTYALLKNIKTTEQHHIPSGQKIKRICILRQNLPSARISNASKWIVEWANSFLHLGCQVMVISANLFEKQRVVSFINVSWDEPFDRNAEYFENDILVRKAYGRCVADRMRDAIDIISDFKPDLVIDTGSHHDMLTCILYKMFPLLHIPLRGSNSSTFFHRSLLQSKKQYEEEQKIFHSIPEKFARFAKYTNIKFDEGKEFSTEFREEFHVATAGNRIKKELSEEFIELMAGWLQEKSNARWYIIGPMEKSDFCHKYHDLVDCGKVVFSGYQKNLAEYYVEEKIDIMVYPKITGVGMCASLAVNSGIPVIKSSSNGDIEKYLGDVSSVEGKLMNLINRLDELYDNVSKRKQLAEEELSYLRTFDGSDEYVLRILEVGKEILGDLQRGVKFE